MRKYFDTNYTLKYVDTSYTFKTITKSFRRVVGVNIFNV